MADDGGRRPIASLKDFKRRRELMKAKRGRRVQTMNVEHFPDPGTRQRYTIDGLFEREMRNRWEDGQIETVSCLAFRETPLVLPLEDERLDAVMETSDRESELKGRRVEVWLEQKMAPDGKTPLGGRHPYKRMLRVLDREPGEDDDEREPGEDDNAHIDTNTDTLDDDVPF